MKKNFLLSISILLVAVLALSACQGMTKSPEADPASQTQVAIFAQATLTKFAEQQPEPTQTSITGFPITITTTEVPTEEPVDTPAEPTEEAPTEVSPTEVPATAVPTVQPTTIPQPTTPANLPQPPSGHERIKFETGTTNAVIKGSVEANQSKRYVLWMTKGQMMSLGTSADNAAYISVKTPSGKVLVSFENRWLWYRDFAQETGDYVIEVSGMAYKSNYDLLVSIPQVLNFERGTSTLTARATIPAKRGHDFSFWANKDQKMTITLSQPEKFSLSIYTSDGTDILVYDGKTNSFDGTLPKAGTYVVTVHNLGDASASVDFNLTIK